VHFHDRVTVADIAPGASPSLTCGLRTLARQSGRSDSDEYQPARDQSRRAAAGL